MKKKIWLLLAAAVLPLLLSGCMMSASVDDLYALSAPLDVPMNNILVAADLPEPPPGGDAGPGRGIRGPPDGRKPAAGADG